MSGKYRIGLVLFALLGLGASIAALYVHYRLMVDPSYSSFCDVSATVSCQQVLESSYGRVLGIPVALENISAPFVIPGAMSEPEFFARLVERTGCSMLLDVTNVLVDSRNHGFDARARVREYPLAAVRQVHLAGGVRDHDGRWIDSHSEPVAAESYALLGELAGSPLQAIVVERDNKLGTLAELVAEALQAEAACR